MRILVTGATGFIGRVLMPVLQRHNCETYAVVRSSAGLPGSWNPIELDLGRTFSAEKLPASIDAVIHLAQSQNYRRFPDAADDILAINVTATARLLHWAMHAGASSFVFASTGSVYSSSPDPNGVFSTLKPDGFYAASKAAAEMLLWPYQKYFSCSALRLFAPYGANQVDRLVPTILQKVSQDTPVDLDGDKGLALAGIHVEDAARIFTMAVLQKWSGVYDIAAPGTFTIRDLAECIGAQLGRQPKFRQTGRPAPQPLLPDLEPMSQHVAPQSMLSLEQGIRRMLGAVKQEG